MFFYNRTQQTFIPVVADAIEGILLGLLTKHAGSVRKDFALIIIGLLLTDLFQEQIVAGVMAAASLWMPTTHPYKGVRRVDTQNIL